MRLITQRLLAVLVALTLVAAGAGGVLAQDAADVSPAGQPPLGATVPFIGEEGTEVATITVTDYVDPFEDYDPSTPPERGYRYVEVGIEVENTGRRPFPFSPYSVYLQDSEGFLYAQTFVYRPTEATEARPDYTGEDVPGGDALSGYLYFAVFSDAEIVRIVYTDGYQRLIFLADLTVEPLIEIGADAVSTPDADTADGTDTDSDVDTDTDADADATTLDLSDAECEDVAAWYQAAEERFADLEGVFQELFSGEEPDPAALRDLADQLRDLADEQADADVPEPAQAANDAVVNFFTAFADVLSNFADDLESGEATAADFLNIFTDLEALGTEFDSRLSELAEACGLDIE